MKKLRRVAAALCLLVGLMVVGTGTVAADYHACDIWPATSKQWLGNSAPIPGGTNTWGVKATFNPTVTTFRPCTPNMGGADGTSAWVSIQPASNPDGDDRIIQVGIVNCNIYDKLFPDWPYTLYDPDDATVDCTPGTLQYFWAAGGCDGALPIGHLIGSANDNQHTYEIRHTSSPTSQWNFYIDGTQEAWIDAADDRVDCWLANGSARYGGAFVETNDDGDGIADAGAKAIFSVFRTRTSDSGTWLEPNPWQTSNCIFTEDTGLLDLKCDNSNVTPGEFYAWSVLW